jgi:hypothetical protein
MRYSKYSIYWSIRCPQLKPLRGTCQKMVARDSHFWRFLTGLFCRLALLFPSSFWQLGWVAACSKMLFRSVPQTHFLFCIVMCLLLSQARKTRMWYVKVDQSLQATNRWVFCRLRKKLFQEFCDGLTTVWFMRMLLNWLGNWCHEMQNEVNLWSSFAWYSIWFYGRHSNTNAEAWNSKCM